MGPADRWRPVSAAADRFDTIKRLRVEVKHADGVARASLWQAARWRTVGRLALARFAEEGAFEAATDARDLRATADDLRDGAR